MKIHVLILCLPVTLAAFSAHANDTPSLFFTKPELLAIDQSLRDKHRALPQASETPLRIDAIMYRSPRDWSFWMQGKEWTPASEDPSIKVLGVSPDTVHLVTKTADDDTPQEVFLKIGDANTGAEDYSVR